MKHVKYGNIGGNTDQISVKYWIISVVFSQNISGNKAKHFVMYDFVVFYEIFCEIFTEFFW